MVLLAKWFKYRKYRLSITVMFGYIIYYALLYGSNFLHVLAILMDNMTYVFRQNIITAFRSWYLPFLVKSSAKRRLQ